MKGKKKKLKSGSKEKFAPEKTLAETDVEELDAFEEDDEKFDAVSAEYENIVGLIKKPSTQQDYEHNAYLRLLHEYNNFVKKREKCRKVGIFVIISLAVLFLILMFSVDSKVVFLTLWVISIFISVFVIIRIDYRCYKYATILGIDDNDD